MSNHYGNHGHMIVHMIAGSIITSRDRRRRGARVFPESVADDSALGPCVAVRSLQRCTSSLHCNGQKQDERDSFDLFYAGLATDGCFDRQECRTLSFRVRCSHSCGASVSVGLHHSTLTGCTETQCFNVSADSSTTCKELLILVKMTLTLIQVG